MIGRNEGRVSLFQQGSVFSTTMLIYELRTTVLHTDRISTKIPSTSVLDVHLAGLARTTHDAVGDILNAQPS